MSNVTIYTKVPCPYCERAMNLLNNLEIPFEKIDLTENMDELNKIKQETGWKTVPIIKIKGQVIGGYTDLKQLDDDGKLLDMVK